MTIKEEEEQSLLITRSNTLHALDLSNSRKTPATLGTEDNLLFDADGKIPNKVLRVSHSSKFGEDISPASQTPPTLQP